MTTMKSPAPAPLTPAQSTGIRPLTLIDAILQSTMSNDAPANSSQPLSLPLPAMTSDTPEIRAVKHTIFLMILDLAMALIEEDGEDDF
jgi:hypothetical protein